MALPPSARFIKHFAQYGQRQYRHHQRIVPDLLLLMRALIGDMLQTAFIGGIWR